MDWKFIETKWVPQGFWMLISKKPALEKLVVIIVGS